MSASLPATRPSLSAAELLRRLAEPGRLDRAGRGVRPHAGDRQAAVLVPLVLHDAAPSVLLTLRAAHLSSHAGQVSFPGGRIEAGENPEQAALREAAEEVGLDPRLPQVIGRLPGMMTGTGFHITPVLAVLQPPLNLVPAPDEVEQAFEYDLAPLLDPALPEIRQAEFRGQMRSFFVWPHETHYVWGATAAILQSLAQVLR